MCIRDRPKEDRAQAKSVLRAAWKLDPKEGIKRVKKLAAWLDERYPSAAASLLEGLEECFTINRLGLPPSLMRCLGTTNVIESPHAGVRIRTHRVTHWQDGKMVLRLSLIHISERRLLVTEDTSGVHECPDRLKVDLRRKLNLALGPLKG